MIIDNLGTCKLQTVGLINEAVSFVVCRIEAPSATRGGGF